MVAVVVLREDANPNPQVEQNLMHEMDEENVPAYSAVDDGGVVAWIENIDPHLLNLPLTHWPLPSWHPDAPQTRLSPVVNPYVIHNNGGNIDIDNTNTNTTAIATPSSDHERNDADAISITSSNNPSTTTLLTQIDKDTLYDIQTRLITSLFTAISTKNTEVVNLLISRGYVSPDVPNEHGTTPLIAAISAGNGTMVCTLMSLGAQVNGYGRLDGQERTPLMAAAAQGRLPLVKLLREDFGADDATIAPDGQLALRLAADAGHREIVEYLPARRGGEWRRWKTHHDVAVRRIRKAGVNIYKFFNFFVWDMPRFFVWSCPKHLFVLPLWKASKWAWKNKRRFRGWCKRQALEFPGRVQRASKAVWRGVKKVPKVAWEIAKEIPGATKRLLKAVWRFIKAIPGAMKKVAVWIWSCLKQAGIAVGNVFLTIVSAIHTALEAVFGFFRQITLRNVWNAVCDVLEAVFITLPKTIWACVKGAGHLAYEIILGLFGGVGVLIWYFFKGLLWVAKFVPTQLWKIICGVGSSMAKGYHEFMVWLNPKH